MSKKKTGYIRGPQTHDDPVDYEEPGLDEPAEVDEPDAPAPVESKPAAAAPPTDSEQYRSGTIQGRPTYGCPYCPLNYMTTNVAIEQHVAEQHPPSLRPAQA